MTVKILKFTEGKPATQWNPPEGPEIEMEIVPHKLQDPDTGEETTYNCSLVQDTATEDEWTKLFERFIEDEIEDDGSDEAYERWRDEGDNDER